MFICLFTFYLNVDCLLIKKTPKKAVEKKYFKNFQAYYRCNGHETNKKEAPKMMKITII